MQFERDFRLRGVNPRSRARHLVIVSSVVYAERGGQPPLYARRYLVLPTRRPCRKRRLRPVTRRHAERGDKIWTLDTCAGGRFGTRSGRSRRRRLRAVMSVQSLTRRSQYPWGSAWTESQTSIFYYSMTSSAWARIDCGIVRHIPLAAGRLTTSSIFVGCSTGRSPGLEPLRILSTRRAALCQILADVAP